VSLGRLTGVAVAHDCRLSLRWDDGRSAEVDLATVVASRTVLRSLADATTFAGARVSDDGWSVEWPDEGIDFGAQQLRRWADEQAGEAMPLAEFRAWLRRHDLTAGKQRAL
jgi:hypothetical protein